MIYGKPLNRICLVRAQDRLSWMKCAVQEMNPTYGHGRDARIICLLRSGSDGLQEIMGIT